MANTYPKTTAATKKKLTQAMAASLGLPKEVVPIVNAIPTGRFALKAYGRVLSTVLTLLYKKVKREYKAGNLDGIIAQVKKKFHVLEDLLGWDMLSTKSEADEDRLWDAFVGAYVTYLHTGQMVMKVER